jgi:hypothetical protein
MTILQDLNSLPSDRDTMFSDDDDDDVNQPIAVQ